MGTFIKVNCLILMLFYVASVTFIYNYFFYHHLKVDISALIALIDHPQEVPIVCA